MVKDLIENFKNKYTLKIKDEKQVNEIIDNAKQIVEATLDKNGMPNGKTGLVIGKVQSGKTSNFLAVTSVALQQRYDMVIIFAGYTNNLVNQTKKRVDELFALDNKNPLDMLGQKPKDGIKVKVSSSTAFLESNGGAELNSIIDELTKGNKIVLCAMKETSHLNKIISVFKENKDLSNKNILVIDDEGDYGSLNGKATSKANNDFFSDENQKDYEKDSTWHKSMIELKKTLPHHYYLSVTATPFGNLLIEQKDDLSPDFIKLTRPGKGYEGLQQFHYENSDKVITIPDKELEFLDNFKDGQNSMDVVYDTSLTNALTTFIVSYSLKVLDDSLNGRQNNDKYQMIVNIAKENKTHVKIANYLNKVVSGLSTMAKKEKENFENTIYRDLFTKSLNIYKKEVEELSEKRGTSYEEFVDSLLSNFIPTVLNEDVDIKELNSNNKSSSNDVEVDETVTSNLTIYVGSNLISRGITFDNLLVSYFAINPKVKQADTTIQRARWFGYRENIFEYMKVYMNETNKEFYEALAINDSIIWDSFNRIDKFVESKRSSNNNDFINLGANSEVADVIANYIKEINFPTLTGRYASPQKVYTKTFVPTGWKTQREIDIEDNAFSDDELIVEEKILPILKESDFYNKDNGKYKFYEFNDFSDFSELVGKRFTDEIIRKISIEDSKWLLDSLISPEGANSHTKLRIIVMNDEAMKPVERKLTRTKREKKFTFQIFGSGIDDDNTVNEKISNGKYIGDRNIWQYPKNSGKLVLLIYKNKLYTGDKSIEIDQYTFALKLPNEIDNNYVKVTRGAPRKR